jgi:hypothetical protein
VNQIASGEQDNTVLIVAIVVPIGTSKHLFNLVIIAIILFFAYKKVYPGRR